MRNVIAVRAGMALDREFTGPHRDKRIAQALGVSVRMAQYLRTGQAWTLDRLAQASSVIGPAFDRWLYVGDTQEQHVSEISDLAARLGALEAVVHAQNNDRVRYMATGQEQEDRGLSGAAGRAMGSHPGTLGGEVSR